MKHVLAVHDFSCVGRCSLTVALPILSAAGVQISAIPTALLSTHTGGFTGYTHLDLTDQLLPICDHLSTLDVSFDAFYSGYLAGSNQADIVLHMIDTLCTEKTHIFVDPAFGDNGKMYSLMDAGMPDKMRMLCSRAHTITPNTTEAALMLGETPPENITTRETVNKLARDLRKIGCSNIIITGVCLSEDRIGCASLLEGSDQVLYSSEVRYPGIFHGTGDVFASLLLGYILSGFPLDRAVASAEKLTAGCIEDTLQSGKPLRYGLCFEGKMLQYAMMCKEGMPDSRDALK